VSTDDRRTLASAADLVSADAVVRYDPSFEFPPGTPLDISNTTTIIVKRGSWFGPPTDAG
jgi:hypothetical protein